MTVDVTFERDDLTVVRARGELRRDEVDRAKHQVHDHMQVHGRQHVLILIEPGFTNLQAFVSWDDIEVDRYIQPRVIRMALVGDLRWREAALMFVITAVSPFKIEYFPFEQEVLAREWLLAP